MFSGLSALVIEDVADGGEIVRVSARTRDVPVPCSVCGVVTGRVHGYHGRTVRDVPVDGRQVVVRVRIRRLVCPVLGCTRQTFREKVPGLLERYQRRTTRLTGQLSELVKELCGRASARLARSLAVPVSYASALRLLRRVPVPEVRVPRVIGVDDFALRRRHSYATIIINAETGERIEVLPGREAATLEAWLRGHPGIEAVCRDGSATYAEAVRRVLPDAVQISDRWHLWHNLAEAVRKEVAAHSTCWAKAGPPPEEGRQAATTRERRQQVHALRERGVGLRTHIAEIVGLIDRHGLTDVILVGHSYGGMVITGAGHERRRHVRQVVYLDALFPSPGESAFGLQPVLRDACDAAAALRPEQEAWLIPPFGFETMGLTAADLEWVSARARPMSRATHEEPLPDPVSSRPDHRRRTDGVQNRPSSPALRRPRAGAGPGS
ncbi:ISL3 family transposase [Streptomyces ardesiacus]|uniref:ISL3 family transposase n=1 Tax=Streptomyces ardesiacus TaxID=285564 RepID=UPI00382F5DD4